MLIYRHSSVPYCSPDVAGMERLCKLTFVFGTGDPTGWQGTPGPDATMTNPVPSPITNFIWL